MPELVRIKIPPTVKLDEHEACPECPFVGEEFSACAIGLGVKNGLLNWSTKPGPSCPGPGEYVLVPAARWEAAMELARLSDARLTAQEWNALGPVWKLARVARGEDDVKDHTD